MTADAANRQVQFVGRRVDGTGRDADRSGRQTRIDVQHRHRVDVRIVEHAGRDHRFGAARAFFRRLKEQHDVAVQRRAARTQFARRAEQHRGVRVVTAGVHLARHFARARFARIFIDRQRVHVGAQRGRAARQRAADHADDAGPGHAPVLDAELVEFALDQRRGLMLFEPELGMAMDLAPNRDRAFARGGGDRRRSCRQSSHRRQPSPQDR